MLNVSAKKSVSNNSLDLVTRKKLKQWVTRRTRRLTENGTIATEKRTKITLPHYSIQDKE